jgi:hypothetical protein
MENERLCDLDMGWRRAWRSLEVCGWRHAGSIKKPVERKCGPILESQVDEEADGHYDSIDDSKGSD